MEINHENMQRFSSCRGVAFEINRSKLSPFSIPTPLEEHQGKPVWFRWNSIRSNTYRVFPLSQALHRSLSRSSSHFCDIEDKDEKQEEERDVRDVEIQIPIKEDEKKISPAKPVHDQNSYSRLAVMLLDQGLFTVYKLLFAVCLTLNVLALVLAINGHFPYARRKATLVSMANILALTLCRSEAFLRLVFWLAVKILGHSSIPLRLKTATTSFLQSLGGIHSGCGVSSIAWLLYALILTLKNRDDTSTEIIAVASAILALLCLSSLAAFPLIRHLHHNVFERTHRFAGWTALTLLWFFVVLTVSYEPKAKTYDVRWSKLAKQQELWFTFAITFLIVLPWLTVRRVPVTVTAPSTHASLIRFAGGIRPGILGRISRSPLSEWHAFGIISDGKKEHIVLAGAVGDFTKGLVSDPPSDLWVRTVHFAGLPYLVNMYKRVVLVATGSGICVFLSFLLQPTATEVCVVWVTKGVEENFGKEIREMMSGFPKEKVIVHDTAVLGRPNVAEMSVDAAKRWRAEVVVVTSNPEGSRDVVRACKGAGIAAFGPIWDS